MPLKVSVQFGTERAGVPHPRSVARWATTAMRGKSRGRHEITVRFVGAREGRALNRRWRHTDHATNVLSFPGQAMHPESAWLGDIVICVPVIRREAQAQGKPVIAHFAHMVVHGVLHLLGFDHVQDADGRKMESIETAILARLGYPDPYRVH